MPSTKNKQQLKVIKEKLAKTKSLVLANHTGLTVDQQQILRRKITEVDGELTVFKNTLLNIALKDKKFNLPEDFAKSLEGPTIVLFAYKDEIAPLKALAEFAKENDLPQIKIGFLNKNPLTKEQTQKLSKLPTKTQLIQKTIGTIKAPITGFVNVLSGNLRNLVYVLEAISKNKI